MWTCLSRSLSVCFISFSFYLRWWFSWCSLTVLHILYIFTAHLSAFVSLRSSLDSDFCTFSAPQLCSPFFRNLLRIEMCQLLNNTVCTSELHLIPPSIVETMGIYDGRGNEWIWVQLEIEKLSPLGAPHATVHTSELITQQDLHSDVSLTQF